MIPSLPPAFIFIGGAVLVPFLRGKVKAAWLLLLPLWALGVIASVPHGLHWVVEFWDYQLILGKVDSLSKVFGYGFSIVYFLGTVYALHLEDDLQQVSSLLYAGGALGVTFAGDFFSLYLFWEVMAVASTFLILAARDKKAQGSAFRYILMHLAGGLLLLAGILLHHQEGGSLQVGYIGLSGLSSWLIFLGIGVNAALPGLHFWLTDAYPRATVTGAVFLCAFTTKSAVYLMARTFPGTELLIPLGAFMCVFPIFYATMENDLRAILSYSLISQVGYMMVGIGIGSQLSLNGAVSHAFCHLLYKSLLFMGAGSVLFVTGQNRCSELGGLGRAMPLTMVCTMVGAASICAFPLFSGFVSKSMIVSAAGHQHLALTWLMLQFGSAGVILYLGLRVPYAVFLRPKEVGEAREAPLNMQIAMVAAAVLCVGVALVPGLLYGQLPFPADYEPYTWAHVLSSLQILGFGALAYVLLIPLGRFLPDRKGINLDVEWFYRKGGRGLNRLFDRVLNTVNAWSERTLVAGVAAWAGKMAHKGAGLAVYLLLLPFWRLSGTRQAEMDQRRRTIESTLASGSTPVGISAAAAAAVLFVVFALC
ncbi:MAG: Na(+)/H(+) antiporter subunit D [Desulfarculaceae bacterium]|jgi:multicomponent Na+:H+ antiporter subunit D